MISQKNQLINTTNKVHYRLRRTQMNKKGTLNSLSINFITPSHNYYSSKPRKVQKKSNLEKRSVFYHS
uniref:Putative ovule protein n=1 Tax=Solanum chacoense TaxID=4108 RepID=A0A0V0H750_SOLCH